MLLSQPSRFFSFFINLVNVERDLLQQPQVMTDAQQGFRSKFFSMKHSVD